MDGLCQDSTSSVVIWNRRVALAFHSLSKVLIIFEHLIPHQCRYELINIVIACSSLVLQAPSRKDVPFITFVLGTVTLAQVQSLVMPFIKLAMLLKHNANTKIDRFSNHNAYISAALLALPLLSRPSCFTVLMQTPVSASVVSFTRPSSIFTILLGPRKRSTNTKVKLLPAQRLHVCLLGHDVDVSCLAQAAGWCCTLIVNKGQFRP